MRSVGLARAISKLGYSSRSQAVKLILAGQVRLNGALRNDPETPVHLEKDRIEIKGQRVGRAEKIYLVLNKPRGVVTTASDEQGRRTVYEFLPGQSRNRNDATWVAPVGRLDKASEGLLLLTNDSEWAARILAPETHLPKTYHVQIGAVAGDDLIHSLARGVQSQGELLSATAARILRTGNRNSWVEIILDEGRNRQIRRMLAALGVEVLRVVRVAIGSLELGELAKGKCRPLTSEEKAALDHAMAVVNLHR